MEDKLVEFETAKLAKEVGFDELCSTWFDKNGRSEEYTVLGKNSQGMIAFYTRPTQSLLQRWLREVHNIIIVIYYEDNTWCTEISNLPYNFADHDIFGGNATYEEALEVGLAYGLEKLFNLIKQ